MCKNHVEFTSLHFHMLKPMSFWHQGSKFRGHPLFGNKYFRGTWAQSKSLLNFNEMALHE